MNIMKVRFSFYGAAYAVIQTDKTIVVHRQQDGSSLIDIQYFLTLAAAFDAVQGMILIDKDQFTQVDRTLTKRVMKHRTLEFFLFLDDQGRSTVVVADAPAPGDSLRRVVAGPYVSTLAEARALVGKPLPPPQRRKRV